jgi:hypothetical protein
MIATLAIKANFLMAWWLSFEAQLQTLTVREQMIRYTSW